MAIKKKTQINKLNTKIIQAQKVIERYEKGIENIEHGKYDAIEILKTNLERYAKAGYLTKEGKIRQNISAEKFEKIAPYLSATLLNKESTYNRVKTVKARTQQKKHIAFNLAENWGVTEKDAKKYIKGITALQTRSLFDVLGFSSDQVMQLALTYENITPETLVEVAEYLITDKNRNVPEFMRRYEQQDDYYRAMIDIFERVDNLPERLKKESIEDILSEEFNDEEMDDFYTSDF